MIWRVVLMVLLVLTAPALARRPITRTVRCSWCPPDLIECRECMDTDCEYEDGSQTWLAAPDDQCPSGIQRHTCRLRSFPNQKTGHVVIVPMPTGYSDQVCTVTPPLPGQRTPRH